MCNSQPVIRWVMALFFCMMTAAHVQAQTIQFSSESDAIQGSVTKCPAVLTGLCTTTTIAPVDQSNTVITGSNVNAAPSASQTVNDVTVYSLTTVSDTTRDSDTASADSGTGEASTGAGNLLGLVTWGNNDDPLTCTAVAGTPAQARCVSTQTTSGLAIAGVPVAPGTYPAGTSFPVSGTITDPDCLGAATFSGNVVLQGSTTQGAGTTNVTFTLTGLHLTGQETCTLAGLVTVYTTAYDLKVAGPAASGNGPDAIRGNLDNNLSSLIQPFN